MRRYHAFYVYHDVITKAWQMGILCFEAENDLDAWEEADRRLDASRLIEYELKDVAAQES